MNDAEFVAGVKALIARRDGAETPTDPAAITSAAEVGEAAKVKAQNTKGPYAYDSRGMLIGGTQHKMHYADPIVGPDCSTAVVVRSGHVLSLPLQGLGELLMGYFTRVSDQLGCIPDNVGSLAGALILAPKPPDMPWPDVVDNFMYGGAPNDPLWDKLVLQKK